MTTIRRHHSSTALKRTDLSVCSKALASPARLRILELLALPEQNFPQNDKYLPNVEGVCIDSIVAVLGLAQSTVSQHLQLLEEAGLTASVKIGRWRYISRCQPVLENYVQQLQRTLHLRSVR